MSKLFISFILLFLIPLSLRAQESTNSNKRFGVSLATNYTLSGIGVIVDLEYQIKNHILYTGPKIPISRTYLPLNSPFGWNIGYRHNYNEDNKRRVNFFFNTDYQISISKAYSTNTETKKKNHIQELFLGYGTELKISEKLYLANVIAIGGYLESYYNVDLKIRKKFWGYDHLFKIFINYKF